MASKADAVRLSTAFAVGSGTVEFAFNDNDVVQLLTIAIEHWGSQMAFAKHHGNMILQYFNRAASDHPAAAAARSTRW